MIYLASPYSHEETAVMQRRFEATRYFTNFHLRLGIPLFSPIVYCHQFALEFDAPTDSTAWATINYEILSRSESMWVLELDGWNTSGGVRAEIEWARELNMKTYRKEPLPNAEV